MSEELKYYNIQVETYLDGHKDSTAYYEAENEKQAEQSFYEKAGISRRNTNIRTALNFVISGDGVISPELKDFFKENIPQGENEIIKYYFMGVNTFVEPVNGNEESIILNTYDNIESAKTNYFSKIGAGEKDENVKTLMAIIFNSHGNEEMLKYWDQYPEPEPEPGPEPEPDPEPDEEEFGPDDPNIEENTEG